MENENGASPAEQLAAEVASDQSQEGTVTADDVAEVLNLPKSGNNGDGDKGSEETEDGEDLDDEAEDDAADTADDSGDSDDDGDEEEAEDEQEVTDTEEKQFVLTVKDANGKEFTIDPDDDIEKILEDFEPKSNGQIFAILKQLQDLGAAKTQYAADQEEQSNQAAYQEEVSNIRANWDKEIAALQGDKRIPVEADGKVPARVSEVFGFMREQNDLRIKEGRPLLQSFEDALDKLELKESKDESAKKAKEEKVLARKRGAVVGGSSAAATSNVSGYRRGARTATEALRQMGVLR